MTGRGRRSWPISTVALVALTVAAVVLLIASVAHLAAGQ